MEGHTHDLDPGDWSLHHGLVLDLTICFVCDTKAIKCEGHMIKRLHGMRTHWFNLRLD